MKKITIVSILILSLLVGCQGKVSDETIIKQRYEAYYNEIINNEVFTESSNYFDITAVLNEIGNNKYRYDVIVDNPKIAMYDVNALVVENDRELFNELNSDLMPLSISTTASPTHLIPFQVNLDKGYAKGIILSGIVSELPLEVKVIVLWKDYGEVKSFKEFLEFEIDEVVEEIEESIEE